MSIKRDKNLSSNHGLVNLTYCSNLGGTCGLTNCYTVEPRCSKPLYNEVLDIEGTVSSENGKGIGDMRALRVNPNQCACLA